MKKSDEYIRIARFYNDWISMESRQKSPNTIISYKKSMRLFIMDFLLGKKNMNRSNFSISEAFSKKTILEWSSWLIEHRGNSIQTRNVRMSNLVCFLKYVSVVDFSYEIYYLEASGIKLRRPAPQRVHSLSQEAIEAVINAPNINTKKGYRDHVLLAFLFATAGRINEVLSLRIKDLELKKNNTGNSYVNFLGKGKKTRTMILLTPIVEQIKQYLKLYHGETPNDNDYLFYTVIHGQRGKMSQKNVALLLKKYALIAHQNCKDVPLSLHSHQFRHTRATLWLKEKHKLPTVSLLLGHEHVETTMRYLDITEDMIADAARETRSEEANSQVQKWTEDTDLSTFFDF